MRALLTLYERHWRLPHYICIDPDGDIIISTHMAIESPLYTFKEQKDLDDVGTYNINVYDKDRKIGGLSGWIRKDCPRFYLWTFKVDVLYRKRGIGTTLLTMMESFSKERKLKKIDADIYSDNPEDVQTMIHFFRSHGYFVNEPPPLPCFALKRIDAE